MAVPPSAGDIMETGDKSVVSAHSVFLQARDDRDRLLLVVGVAPVVALLVLVASSDRDRLPRLVLLTGTLLPMVVDATVAVAAVPSLTWTWVSTESERDRVAMADDASRACGSALTLADGFSSVMSAKRDRVFRDVGGLVVVVAAVVVANDLDALVMGVALPVVRSLFSIVVDGSEDEIKLDEADATIGNSEANRRLERGFEGIIVSSTETVPSPSSRPISFVAACRTYLVVILLVISANALAKVSSCRRHVSSKVTETIKAALASSAPMPCELTSRVICMERA